MALNNIEMVAQKMQGDDGPKIIVTVWGDETAWLNVQIGDDAALGAQLMDAVLSVIDEVQ